MLRLALRTPDDLTRAATLCGPSPELAAQPLSLHLQLALVARGAAVDAATAMAATIVTISAHLGSQFLPRGFGFREPIILSPMSITF